MFGTAIRVFAKNRKPPMKPIELTMPPEQAQTVTRVIFGILNEHGPLTVGDTWERVKALNEVLTVRIMHYIFLRDAVMTDESPHKKNQRRR